MTPERVRELCKLIPCPSDEWLQALGTAIAREARREALTEAASVAARHYIVGHTVAGPEFAETIARAIRALIPLEPKL